MNDAHRAAIADGSTLQRHQQRAERDQCDPEPIEHGQLLPKQERAKNRDQDDAEFIDRGDL